jgi:hypothetical protein
MATTFDLSVIFRAIDKLSVPMNKMQGKLDNFSAKAKKLGDSLSNVGRKMTMGITVPIIGMGVAMIKTASDLEESINKVDVAFEDSADNVKDWSKTTLQNFGIAQGTALDMAATFGDMGTSMDIPVDKAADMSKSLVGLAGDLASFKNIRIEQANTALSAIYTGETESLKKLGIVMTEVNLEEFARSKGITKSIKKMSQMEKVLLRYNFVMAKTKNSHGDFVRTGGGAANQMRIFTESLKELAANFGEIILPIFTKIITKINKVVQWFGNLNPKVKKTILIILGLAAAIGPLIWIIGKLITVVSMAGKVFKVLRMIMTPQGAIILGIIAAIILIIIVIKNWGKISKWFINIWSKFKAWLDKMPQSVLVLISVFLPFIGLPLLIIKNWSRVISFFKKVWRVLDKKIIQAIVFAFFPLIGIPLLIIKNWKVIIKFLKGVWKGFTELLNNPVVQMLTAIFFPFIGIPLLIIKNWEPISEFFIELGKSIMEVGRAIDEFFANPSLEAFKNVFGIETPENKDITNATAGVKEKSAVDVNIKVASDKGSTTTVQGKKDTGNAKSKIFTENYLGYSHTVQR